MKATQKTLSAISVILLTACAGYVPFPVADIDRDNQKMYDGRWSLDISARTRIPRGDSKQFVCEIAESSSILVVEDGIARVEGMPAERSANVSTKGQFRLEIPTDENLRRRNGLAGINSELTLVYKGTLSEQESTGVFVHARGASQAAECSTTMSIMKLS